MCCIACRWVSLGTWQNCRSLAVLHAVSNAVLTRFSAVFTADPLPFLLPFLVLGMQVYVRLSAKHASSADLGITLHTDEPAPPVPTLPGADSLGSRGTNDSRPVINADPAAVGQVAPGTTIPTNTVAPIRGTIEGRYCHRLPLTATGCASDCH